MRKGGRQDESEEKRKRIGGKEDDRTGREEEG